LNAQFGLPPGKIHQKRVALTGQVSWNPFQILLVAAGQQQDAQNYKKIHAKSLESSQSCKFWAARLA
jgi:hypothetical protein